jgi:predicted TIM-barrel fold metal-dependent hydrolase
MPVLFVGHGSPMNAISDNEYRRSWQALGARFGSDWPVCLLAGSFKQVYDVVARFTEQLNATEKEKIFGTNTAAFYKI